MRNWREHSNTTLRALKLGLAPYSEKEGIYHFRVRSEADEAEILNKMSEFEANGFFYQGIKTMVGNDGYLVFSVNPCAQEII